MSQCNNNPEITIVIGTRNRCTFLTQAVASARAQCGVKSEILIVDDASTDNTPALFDNLCRDGVRCIRLQEHMERSAVRNRGLAEAHGGFIMFLDDDDFLQPGALAVLKHSLEKHPEAVAAVGARQDWFVDEHYKRRDTHPRFQRCRRIFNELLFGWSAVSGQNLFRTHIIRSLGGFDSSVIPCEDRDLWLRLAPLGPVVLQPEIVMTYRVHSGQFRPADIRRLREYVARRAILALPRTSRRHSLVLRRCASLVEQAEALMLSRHYAAGTGCALRAFALAPELFASPLIGPWIARRLAGRIWHSWHTVQRK